MPAGGFCVKSKSVDVRKNYLAENVNWQDVITTQLEVFFVNSGAKDSIAAWLSWLTTYASNGAVLPTLTVGTVTFTNCRIIKVDVSPEAESINNAIQHGYINLTIEEKVAGDLGNVKNDSGDFVNGSNLGTLLETNGSFIDSITEDVSYTTGLNGQFSLRHSVSVAPNEYSTTTQADLGLTIARAVLDNYLPQASNSANNSSIHNLLVGTNGIVGNLSATINRINGEATLVRTIDLLSNTDGAYDTTYEYTHTLDLTAEGIMKVTESGKILSAGKHGGNLSSYYASAVAELNNQLTAAAGRCSSLFTDYVNAAKFDMSFAGVVVPPLGTLATETVKNFNEISQEVSYSISFSNDENLLSGYTIDRSTDINKDKDGVVTLSEKTSFLSHYEKCDLPTPLIDSYNTDVAGAEARVLNVWASFNSIAFGATPFFNLISRDLSYNPDGKSLNYSIAYSADKTIASPGSDWETNGIKKLTMNTSDKLPQRMIQEYPIAPLGMLLHNPGQTGLGSRTVTITASLDRLTAYTLLNPAFPSLSLPYIASLARTELLNVFTEVGTAPDDIFVSEISCNFDSKRSLTLTATAQYLATR